MKHERAHYMSQLINCLPEISTVDAASVIVGDLNCGDVDWSNLCSPRDGVHDTFWNFTVQQGYSQLVTEPTRDNTRNILDLLLTNEPVSICDVSVQQPFSIVKFVLKFLLSN